MNKTWRHRHGDEYIVITAQVEGDTESGFRIANYSDRECYSTLAAVKRHGFETRKSDDFNIGAIRNNQLAAVLWMSEIIDGEPKILQTVAREIDLA